VLDRVTVLAAETAEKTSHVPTIIAWTLMVLALLGIAVGYVRWR
jgi:hypothetical protein